MLPEQPISIDPASVAIADIPAALASLAAEQSRLAAQQSALAARLLGVPAPAPQTDAGDKLLTVDEAAARLAVTPEWLYRRGKRLGLAVKLGDGTLRFSSVALNAYIKGQTISPASTRRRRTA